MNEIDFTVWEDEKANESESTSWWFQINSFSIVAKCGSLREIEVNVNLVVWLKERLEAPYNYILK